MTRLSAPTRVNPRVNPYAKPASKRRVKRRDEHAPPSDKPGAGPRAAFARLTPLAPLLALTLGCSEDATDEPLSSAPRCNGSTALCERRFDQVVFPSTHNSMSNADDGWLAPNQEHGIERQLEDGVRGFLLDTHYSADGEPALCHSSCSFGQRPLSEALGAFTRFLHDEPREVLALLVEDYVSPEDTERAFEQSGLRAYVYTHPPGASWPTLEKLIARGERVVVMAQNEGGDPAWYHPLWELAWDTPYRFEQLTDFSCELNRGHARNPLFLLNHWVERPLASRALSELANTHEVLLGRARRCHEEAQALPNFVAVNHYATGDLLRVVAELNGTPGGEP